jgi:hypothetical protein
MPLLVWAVPTVLLALVGATAAIFWPKPVDAPAFRTAILPPPGVSIRDTRSNLPARRLAISPDGRQLAFTGTERDGSIRLWVRALEGTTARAIEGSDGAAFPFWSPDSHSAFLREAPSADGKRAERVEHLIGSSSSGVPDLAERHREYGLASLKHAR